MNPITHHTIAACVAAVIASVVAVGTVAEMRQPPVHIVQTRQARIVPEAWQTLDQKQIDALTAELKTKGAPERVTIVCIKPILCDEFELDLENAFESAHWPTQSDTLVFGDAIGMISNDKRVADAVTKATGLPVKFDNSAQVSTAARIEALGGVAPKFEPRLIIGRNKESVQ
jgi:hypothetical protein